MTPVGTAVLLPDREALASGLLVLNPRLCEHEGVFPVAVGPDGHVDLPSLRLYGPLVPFLEQEVRAALAPHIGALSAVPTPSGWLSVSGHRLSVRVGSGTACVTEDHEHLSVTWCSGAASRTWAVWRGHPAALDDGRLYGLRQADRRALVTFHDALTLAYEERAPGIPLEVALATLRAQVRELHQARAQHREYWSAFALEHLRAALKPGQSWAAG